MLNIQNGKIAKEHVGVTVSPHTRSYLAIYSLAKGAYMTTIIRNLIEVWISKQRLKETDSQLIRQVIVRINSLWKTSKILNPQLSFCEFINITREDLLAKGILKNEVELILKEVKEK